MRDIPGLVAERNRIAIIAHTHPSVTKGGAEVAAYALYRGLCSLGVHVIFIAACPRQLRKRVRLGSAREFIIPYEPDRYEHFYQLGEPAVGRALLALLQSERIGVVNFHHFLNFGANVLRSLTAVSVDETAVFLTMHEYLPICHHHGQMVTRPARQLCNAATPHRCATCFPEHTPQQFAQRRERMLQALGGLAGYIAPSRFLARRMVAWGLPEDRVTVIENGLLDILPPGPPLHVVGGAIVFGYFGQITPFKGVDRLLDAVALLAARAELRGRVQIRIHGVMIGQPAAFEQRFRQALDSYAFLHDAGAYDNSDVGALMRACHYVVVPSTWWENSPVVIQEAFMAGCPVICSGIGGMAEKVADGVNGLHVQAGSGADLARAIAQAADPAVHARLVAGLPAVSDHLAMARAYLQVFATALPQDAAPLAEHATAG